jgi:hypothetical protein
LNDPFSLLAGVGGLKQLDSSVLTYRVERIFTTKEEEEETLLLELLLLYNFLSPNKSTRNGCCFFFFFTFVIVTASKWLSALPRFVSQSNTCLKRFSKVWTQILRPKYQINRSKNRKMTKRSIF